MKAMVLKEFCEIEIEGEARRRTDLPLKTEPLEIRRLPATAWLLMPASK